MSRAAVRSSKRQTEMAVGSGHVEVTGNRNRSSLGGVMWANRIIFKEFCCSGSKETGWLPVAQRSRDFVVLR